MEQKIKAIQAGIGGGFLPKKRIQALLDSGELAEVSLLDFENTNELFLAWKTVNRGKGLEQLREMIMNQSLAQAI